MKIYVLIENTTDSDLQCEHGLSLYIEYKDKKILLDAGSTEVFAENARQMGVDLAAVDLAFLSHGHYDHSGGFGAWARVNKSAQVYAMESAMGRYASASGGAMHEIGVPEAVKEVLKERIAAVDKVTQVAEGIVLVPHSTAQDKLAAIGEKAGLYREAMPQESGEMTEGITCEIAGKTAESVICETTGEMVEGTTCEAIGQETFWMPDEFTHEMSVVFETDAGLVICNSCSHGGVQNIVEEVKSALPGQKIYAFVGGLHMKGRKDGEEICTFSEEEVQALTDCIRDAGIEVLITGHCTGEPAIALLEKYLVEGQLMHLCTGTVYELGGQL